MSWFSRRRFSALLSPAGIHVVEYRGSVRGVRILRYSRDLADPRGPADAIHRLADLLEAEGARGAAVALSVVGFGSYHHLLTLPPAPRDILLPVITRELRRFYPDLFEHDSEPFIDFAEVDSSDHDRAGQQKELLAAAVPRSLLEAVDGALSARGIRLEHWTILPRAMQRLHDAFGDAFHTEAALLMVPGAPVLGFFHEGDLRLFTEPMLGHQPAPDTEIEAVTEQVERGALFLRQQFRGTSVNRLLASVDDEGQFAALAERLAASTTIAVERFGSPGQPPGALAALGAGLDAAAPDALNLLPPEARPPSAADRWAHALALAGVALFLVAAAWWATSGLRLEAQARQQLERVESALTSHTPAFAAVRTVVGERQAHAQRAALLGRIRAQHEQLPEMLWALAAAPGPIEVTALHLGRSEEGWTGGLAGISRAGSPGVASGAVDALFQGLATSLGGGTVSLTNLAYVRPTDPPDDDAALDDMGDTGAIAISFEMSFIVPAAEDPSP